MTMMKEGHGRRQDAAGFSLIEALIAVIILVFGLVAVAQLLAAAAGSNTVANRSTAAAAQASEQLERLMSVPYMTLAMSTGGTLDVAGGCGGTNVANRFVDGVGNIRTCWQIATTTTPSLLRITVRSEALGLFSAMTRAEFTTFRTMNGVAAGQAGP